MFAIMAENEEIVKLLIENKADTQTIDNSRKSTVDFAKDCDSKVIKQLIIK
jgi:hypothetical protein